MLPVSSATTSCSCNGQIPIYGGLKSVSSYLKSFDCYNVNKVKKILNCSKRRPVTCLYSIYVEKGEQCCSIDINQSLYQSGCSSVTGVSYESNSLGPNTIFVESSIDSSGDDQLTDFIGKTIENTDLQSNYTTPSFNDVPIDSPSVPESLNIDVNPLSDQKTSVSDIFAQVNSSFTDTINGGENVLNKSLDTINSSLNEALSSANEAVDNVINDINTFFSKTGETAGNKLSGFSGTLKKGSGTAGSIAVDVLRRVVVTVEDVLALGAKNVGYAYGFTKEFLPQEFQDALSSTEGRVVKVLGPVGTGFQQVYIALGGFEESIGLDPNDPLIPVVLFLGVSAVLWGSFRVLKYGGYAGDLSPQSTFEILRGNESAALIDIRPENLRDKDGVPDLRRKARYRYVSLTLPEVNGSVKKLLKGGRDVEDLLLAAVIHDLKIVEDRSKVLVMDADGTRSKGVARSLKKLGTKRPYQVEGGFQSWVKEGCRVKELRPETTFTILNEEAEAILEEINPTPLKVIGVAAGVAAASYSLLEWETTLQFIGVIGLGLTIFRRVTSYQKAEDVKQDLRFLLAPVALGREALSWAAGKLETNGLPTSPSSSDVQSRVQQAAAKLQSQPDSPQVATSGNEEVNISEA
ncbi:hypothetical protein ACS0TY_012595 [Phlomoides rotata]